MRGFEEIAADLDRLAEVDVPEGQVRWLLDQASRYLLREAAEALRRHEAYVRVCGGKHAVRYLESDQICPYCVLADAEAERELMRKEVGGWRKEHHLVTTERDRLRLGLVNAGAEMSEIRDERDALIAFVSAIPGWRDYFSPEWRERYDALPEPLRQRIEAEE